MGDDKPIYGNLFCCLIFLCATLLFNARASNVTMTEHDWMCFNASVNVVPMPLWNGLVDGFYGVAQKGYFRGKKQWMIIIMH